MPPPPRTTMSPPRASAMPLPSADAVLPAAAAATTPQERPTTPTPPTTPPTPTEEIFFEVGCILPGWKQVFILENLPRILGNRRLFKHVVTKNEPYKRGIRVLKPMCMERGLPRTGSKTVLILRLVGYYFTNIDKFESDFEGLYDEFEVKWRKAKERMQDEELSARAVLAVAPDEPPPHVLVGFGYVSLP
jgi:hypothetical protein